MKTEQLDYIMNWKEVSDYLIATPADRLPTFEEAKKLDKRSFWVSDTMDDLPCVYDRGELVASHPLFRWSVVVVVK